MTVLQGKKIQGGVVSGSIVKLEQRPEVKKVSGKDPAAEGKRLEAAMRQLLKQLDDEQQAADRAASGILSAQRMMLEDPSWSAEIRKILCEERVTAEYAVMQAGEALAKKFEAMEDPYLRARSEDMRQVSERLCDTLTGFVAIPMLKKPVILCAEAFTPAQLAVLPKEKVLGLAAWKGSPASHTAILAGSYGLPYLIGIDPKEVDAKQPAVLDGDAGQLILSPDAETVKKAETAAAEKQRLLASTPEKTRMKVYANIASPADLDLVLKYQADGIGLFRTEFLFMNRDSAPDEEEQYNIYREVLEKMAGKEVVIRTIDIGTDKPASWLDVPKEENPALGLRGVRVSLWKPELFQVQLRALLRAACHGDERVMFPMITSVKEVEEIREQVSLAAESLKRQGTAYRMPALGVMVETPAAALIAGELGKHVDFFSLGTNDLTQYTLALDRQAQDMERYYDPYHEGILTLISMTIRGAHENGIPAGICGQLGGDPRILKRMVREGLDEVSVAPASIPLVRHAVAEAEKWIAEEAPAADQSAAASDGFMPASSGAEDITAPVNGELVPMEKIPDATFSTGVLGPCFAVEPTDGHVCAPVSGTVTTVAPTAHAISLKTDAGTEILVHAGINTVSLKGKGFSVPVKPGDRVSRGDPLLDMDIGLIRQAGLDPMVMTILLGQNG